MLPDKIRLDGVRVLVVDDEVNLLRVARRILTRHGAEVECAGDGLAALEVVATFQPDIILSDLRMPEMDGLALLRELQARESSATVVVLTGHGTMETAIEAMRLGARDYLLKPCDPEALLLVIHREIEALLLRRENRRLAAQVASLTQRLGRGEADARMVGDSAPMQEVYGQIERLCRFHDMTVLVMGKTGTGKELVARALHRGSPRAAGPFVAINCAAIPQDLQESQLFGHRRGAFTGASEDHLGAFEAAHGGTLLLDEIGEMRPELQAKLLRALEQREITPLGANEAIAADVRVIASTNRDLAAAVAQGAFRADLYNRIEGAVIRLPLLRDRAEDIPELARHFLDQIAAEYAVHPKTLAPSALARLREYAWPGNVRELQNVVKRAFVFSNGDVIGAADLDIAPSPNASPPAATSPAQDDDLGLWDQRERAAIVEALRRSGGNKSEAARILGIDRKRLYRRLARYGLE